MSEQNNIPPHFLARIQEAKEKQLVELDLINNWSTKEENKLTIIPPQVFELTQLKSLNLCSNRIEEIPESIGNLTQLNQLDLTDNRIKNIPEVICNLTNLTDLSLSWNKIGNIPELIGNLTNLTELYLAMNIIKEIPQSITNLTKLRELYLNSNEIRELPESIVNLTNLKELDLSYNEIRELPESIVNLTNLNKLDLFSNPIESLPLEVALKGIESIREYFRQLEEEGKENIYEAKLLILGEGGAGKTTFTNKIINEDYQLQPEEESTEGIDVNHWYFDLDDDNQFRVNLWDFGGQEIFHATHQFFLTKRSLYTLVADTRREDTDFFYWLNLVDLLSDNSPLLIIKNERQNLQVEIADEANLRKEFSNLKETLATNLADNRGLESIKKEIKHHIKKLPHIGSALPKTWVRVRRALESDPRDFISIQEFFEICENNGFKQEKDKLQLSGYLHDLGVCLHFQDNKFSPLYRMIILKPEWATKGVYKVLRNEKVIANQGCFTLDDLQLIWHEEKFKGQEIELLELMKKFQLCYGVPYRQDTFVAPQLLSQQQPQYNWDENNNLRMNYRYPDFMIKGVITRFIVAMHQYIDRCEDNNNGNNAPSKLQQCVWRNGVVLVKGQAKAEAIESYGKREITIRVSGANGKDLMAIVSNEIDRINDSYERLNYQKLIPCNCDRCREESPVHFFNFNKLVEKYCNGKYVDTCDNYPYSEVSIMSLLDNTIDFHKYLHDKRQSLDDRGGFSLQNNKIDRLIMQLGGDNPRFLTSMEEMNMGNKVTQTHSGSGNNVAGDMNITNNYNNSQDLTQAAAEIQSLLEQLSKGRDVTNRRDKNAVVMDVMDAIEQDKSLMQKVVSALKASGIAAFDSLVDHPVASALIAGMQDWLDN